MVARSVCERSDSVHPRSSAILTAAPERWCVSLKGTPASSHAPQPHSSPALGPSGSWLARAGRCCISAWQWPRAGSPKGAASTFAHEVLGQVCGQHVCAEPTAHAGRVDPQGRHHTRGYAHAGVQGVHAVKQGLPGLLTSTGVSDPACRVASTQHAGRSCLGVCQCGHTQAAVAGHPGLLQAACRCRAVMCYVLISGSPGTCAHRLEHGDQLLEFTCSQDPAKGVVQQS